jgi:transposase-like protein
MLIGLVKYALTDEFYAESFQCFKNTGTASLHDNIISFGKHNGLRRTFKDVYDDPRERKYIDSLRSTIVHNPRSGLGLFCTYIKSRDNQAKSGSLYEHTFPEVSDKDMIDFDLSNPDLSTTSLSNVWNTPTHSSLHSSGIGQPSSSDLHVTSFPHLHSAATSSSSHISDNMVPCSSDFPATSSSFHTSGVKESSSLPGKTISSDKIDSEVNVCSHFPRSVASNAQKCWMAEQCQLLGFLPKTPEYNDASKWENQNFFRFPPHPESQRLTFGQLPKPDPYWLKPAFFWFPEKAFKNLLPEKLSCVTPGCQGEAKSIGLGNARACLGTGPLIEFYVVCSRFRCTTCKKDWQSSDYRFLSTLPDVVSSVFPVYVSENHQKMVSKSIVELVRRGGRAFDDIARELNITANHRYETAHNQYLLLTTSVRTNLKHTVASSACNQPIKPFGCFDDKSGYCGTNVDAKFLRELCLTEYQNQKPYLDALQRGVFGNFFRSDYTSKVAKKIENASFSFSVMNEYSQIVGWYLVKGEGECNLKQCCEGLLQRYTSTNIPLPSVRWVDKDCCSSESSFSEGPRGSFNRNSAFRCHFNKDMDEKLDGHHFIDRFARMCTSANHPDYPKFVGCLADALYSVDQEDHARLLTALKHLGVNTPPSKDLVRRHCKLLIKQPDILLTEVQKVVDTFEKTTLFSSDMAKTWENEKIHIIRGCLSDPKMGSHRIQKYVQLKSNKSPLCKLPVYQSIRSSSQLEGFHAHQNKFIPSSHVGGPLAHAELSFGTAQWNRDRAVELRGHRLPLVLGSNPKLIFKLNSHYRMEHNVDKYPDVSFNFTPTTEKFGYDYLSSASMVSSSPLEKTASTASHVPSTSTVSSHSETTTSSPSVSSASTSSLTICTSMVSSHSQTPSSLPSDSSASTSSYIPSLPIQSIQHLPPNISLHSPQISSDMPPLRNISVSKSVAPVQSHAQPICKDCDQYKSTATGNPLHFQYTPKGETGMFYCPTKMNKSYGTPVDMNFQAFKDTDFFTLEIKRKEQEKQQAALARDRRKREREQKGKSVTAPTKKDKK